MWKRLFSWKTKIPNGERLEMEAKLDEVFQPILPRPQFVNGLRRTLKNYSILEEENIGKVNEQDLIVILAGFFSAALLLSIGIRALLTLIGAIGVMQYHKRQTQREQVTAPLKPAI